MNNIVIHRAYRTSKNDFILFPSVAGFIPFHSLSTQYCPPFSSNVLFPAILFARGVHAQPFALGLGHYDMINSKLLFSNKLLEF
jgi:hypothetical protein